MKRLGTYPHCPQCPQKSSPRQLLADVVAPAPEPAVKLDINKHIGGQIAHTSGGTSAMEFLAAAKTVQVRPTGTPN